MQRSRRTARPRMHGQCGQQQGLDERGDFGEWSVGFRRHEARRRRVCGRQLRPGDHRLPVDASTLTGTVTADSNGECPGGQITQVPVQLKKIS